MPYFSEWKKLPVSLAELSINITLRCGQTFRWQRLENDEWRCALHGRIVSLRQDSNHIYYRTYLLPEDRVSTKECISREDDTEALIRHYFNLDTNLSGLYKMWSLSDQNFEKKARYLNGVRILRQDAWEALVSFICSSNNNISRISQMVAKLCENYGEFIGRIDEKSYYDFPSPSALIGNDVQTKLGELGFGYRAKYISQTANIVAKERQNGWLDSLRNPENPKFGGKSSPGEEMRDEGRYGYRRAHDSLLQLQGVGPKVADCVCLMGLGWREAVPIDTHVWQIAQRDYKLGKGKYKSLTRATYDIIGRYFRQLWGKEAGWAHSVLFTADLKSFSEQPNSAKVEKEESKILYKDQLTLADDFMSKDDHVPGKRYVFQKTGLKNEDVGKDGKSVRKRRRTRRSYSVQTLNLQ